MPTQTNPIGSMLRILLLTVVFGLVVGVVLWSSALGREQALTAEITRLEAQMAEQVALRDAMLERLQQTRRLARLEVLSQSTGADGQVLWTSVRFVELDDTGAELARRDYEVPGSVVFVDGWTIRFEHEHVAQGDPFAGQTLVLFRRLYSDAMPPDEGFPIDTPGGVPEGYAVSAGARYEQALWGRFWNLASDPVAAKAAGVRVAQGEAVYKRVAPGERYDLLAEASGGMTMLPIGNEPDSQFAIAENE